MKSERTHSAFDRHLLAASAKTLREKPGGRLSNHRGTAITASNSRAPAGAERTHAHPFPRADARRGAPRLPRPFRGRSEETSPLRPEGARQFPGTLEPIRITPSPSGEGRGEGFADIALEPIPVGPWLCKLYRRKSGATGPDNSRVFVTLQPPAFNAGWGC
jgi:hypothetical protein